jgi:hypothetical protein
MKVHSRVTLCGFLAFAGFVQTSGGETETEAKNKAAVQTAFQAWRAGTVHGTNARNKYAANSTRCTAPCIT